MATGSAGMKQYAFTDLRVLKESKKTIRSVNVIAAVKFFRDPIKTRGTSYSITVGLTDPSLEGGKLICTLFNDDRQRLPQIRASGDVLVCHRLLVERFAGEMRGSGLPGLGFSSAVIPGDPEAALEVQSEWDHFNITSKDLAKANELRKWFCSPACPVSPEPKRREEPGCITPRTVSQLTKKTYCDLSGQLLAKFRLAASPNTLLLRMWDGTAPPCRFRNVEDIHGKDVINLEEIASPETRWLSRFRFVDVAVFDEHVDSCAAVGPGDLLLLTNLRVCAKYSSSQPLLQLWLQGGGQYPYGRGVRQLHDHEKEAQGLEARLSTVQEGMQVTRVRDEGRRTTLTRVLTLALKNLNFKYCIRARVRSVIPARAKEIVRVFCPVCEKLQPEETEPSEELGPCDFCGGATELILQLQVVFQERGGEIRAHLWREQALYFLAQFISTPAELLTDPDRALAVTATLQCLEGLNMDAVIVTYLPSAAKGNPDLLQVQMWDTQLTRD